ncbi:hypothetical protein C8T65DRAFT_700732 [Cerioporus squamosus]|nr:hypothetical protein C8T65DRAFT_700732 [Cerioporus squamosus]
MSHPSEEASAPATLRFDEAVAFHQWLECSEPQEPDLRLSAWRVLADPCTLDDLIRYAGRLPALRELYLSLRNLAMGNAERDEPSTSPTTSRTEAVAVPERTRMMPDVRDEAVGAERSTTDTSVSHPSASEPNPSTNASSLLPGPQGGGQSVGPQHSQDPPDGGTPDIWPLLNLIHGDLVDVAALCRYGKGHVWKLLIRLPPNAFVETASKEQFSHVMRALAPEKLVIGIHKVLLECHGLSSAFLVYDSVYSVWILDTARATCPG